MRIAELKRVKDQRPFRPFSIRMADGREIEITHPDAIAWEGEFASTAICVIPGGEWEIIDVGLANSLGMQAPQSLIESKKT
jgi:hypothetical protein